MTLNEISLASMIALLTYSLSLFLLEYIPQWLRWAQYLCSLTYAVRLALEGEFNNCAEEGNPQCEDILNVSNVYQMDIYIYWIILLVLFVFFRISALLVLKRKASTFY